MIKATKIYVWKRLRFPLWISPRPQFELFQFVTDLLNDYALQSVLGGDDGSREATSREWTFATAISEVERIEIHTRLVEYYGDANAGNFRWDGTLTTVSIHDVFTMGNHIQPPGSV